jgi:toxin ParE1/3/4
MRLVLTDAAARDLDDILATMAREFPAAISPFERRLRMSLQRIALWPEGAREVEGRPGVRVVPMVRYPFRIFYRVSGDSVVVLHIHYAQRVAT